MFGPEVIYASASILLIVLIRFNTLLEVYIPST